MVYAHGRQRFECDSPGAMRVRLNTALPGEAHQESEMQLQNGQRYEVYFDQTRHKWDIRLATAGG